MGWVVIGGAVMQLNALTAKDQPAAAEGPTLLQRLLALAGVLRLDHARAWRCSAAQSPQRSMQHAAVQRPCAEG